MPEPAPATLSPTPKRPLVVGGYRNENWEGGTPCRLTKGTLKNLKSLGYSRVRVQRFGDPVPVEQDIAALLAIPSRAPKIITSDVRCTDPTHRSYSADGDFDECQLKWHAKYALGVVDPMPDRVAVGSAVDVIVKQRLLGRSPKTETVVRAEFARCHTPLTDLEAAVTKADSLLALWESDVRPLWEAVGIYAVEWELHFTIPNTSPKVVYHVHIDVVLRDGTIIDLKTSEQRLGTDRAMYDVQLTTYAAALLIEFGQIAPSAILDGLIYAAMPKDVAEMRGIRDKDRPKPWHDRQVSNRTAEQVDSWIASVIRRERAYGFAEVTGVYQTQGRSAQYACNGCPARPTCPEWTGWEGMFDSKEVISVTA